MTPRLDFDVVLSDLTYPDARRHEGEVGSRLGEVPEPETTYVCVVIMIMIRAIRPIDQSINRSFKQG